MPITFKLNTTPTAGSVVSVPVAFDVTKANYYHEIMAPADAGALAWNDSEFLSPIARGDRAHLFVVDCPLDMQGNPYPGTVINDQYKLDILSSIQSIKSQQLPLTDWMEKMANAYTFDYANPYTSGIIVGLSNDDQDALESQFTAGRITPTNEYPGVGVMTIHHYGGNGYSLAYYGLSELPFGSSDWLQDGFDKNNMYTGYFKDRTTGDVKQVSINKLKSAFAPADVNNHQIEVYRGLRFYTDPDTGNLKAGTILVIVDWADTDTYTLYDSDNQPYTTTGPKAIFSLSAANAYSTFDSSYSGTHTLDVYAASPANEFDFIPYSNGGGGGGGNNGRGGRAVTSDIPMRITSRNDVDYRHFLDLYDETNYNERNMFLTNFVGRIPYKLVEYDSSEAGGTGVIRVSTDLQFTHFVGASFSDGNVPRVYEVISHKSMGGSPNVLLCTFRVCHLKDYFQHFGVTSENEFLVERSTASGLYNPWLEDARLLSDNYSAERYTFTSFAYDPRVMIVLNDNRVITLQLGTPSDTCNPPVIPGVSSIFDVATFRGLLNTIETIDNDPRASLGQVSFVNGVLSRIRAVYLVPEQVNQSTQYGTVEMEISIPFYSDPSDPTSLTSATYTLRLSSAREITSPGECIWFNKIFTNTGGAMFSDWTDINASWYVNVPWYGGLSLSGTAIKKLIDYGNGSFDVRYYVSPLDGSITIASDYTGNAPAQLLPWKKLPTIPVPSSSRTLSYRMTGIQERANLETRNDQTNAGIITAGATAAVAAAGSMVTGNVIGAGAALVGGVAGVVGISVSNDIRNKYSMLGTNLAAASITAEALTCSGYEMLALNEVIFIKTKRAEIINLYDTVGYPCRVRWRSVGAVNGVKYWVSILGNIRGTSAYAQAIRGEIERDGIIYNYS